MDVPRRAAGARRSRSWWDRGQWFCGLTIALLGVGLGVTAVADEHLGRRETGTVEFCRTELHAYGRWLGNRTMCDVTVDGWTVELETSESHDNGSEIELLVNGDTVLDAHHAGDQAWWLPAGLLTGAATWWIGFPPRKGSASARDVRARSGGGRHL